MIHTMCITHWLNKKEFDQIFKAKGANLYPDLIHSINNSKVYKTEYLKDEGLTQITLRQFQFKKTQFQTIIKYQIEILLNPKRLIDQENRVEILQPHEVQLVADKFNKLIESINPNLQEFYEWNLTRMDYAIDLITENVKEYVKLFQRSDKPRFFNEQLLENRHRGQKSGSFYLITHSLRINFYDKQDQVEKNERDARTIIEARNIMRLEVQLGRTKIRQIAREQGFLKSRVYYFLSKEISCSIITDYYMKTVGKGDYYTLAGAREKIIRDKNLNPLKKSNLINCLQLINEKRSIWKAREEFQNNRMFNSYLKQLRRIGINPVTIPLNWGIDFLRNPCSV